MTAINNLIGKYVYKINTTNMPIVFLMHGFLGPYTEVLNSTMQRIADQGFFVLSINMRSVAYNGPGAPADCSGRMIHDIYDAITYIRATFPLLVSPDKVGFVGYSGGGGNAFALCSKFPDAFTVIVSFYGISDYGRSAAYGWYLNSSDVSYRAVMDTQVGGNPTTYPDRYYARDSTVAAQNFSGGKLFMYHDKGDLLVEYHHTRRVKDAFDAVGQTNYSYNVSETTDAIRWLHGTLETAPAPTQEAIWGAELLSRAAWTIPASGTVTVIGYIVTKRFTIWLNTNGTTTLGIDAVATVVYNTATDQYTVTPLTSAPIDVTITQGAKTGSAVNINSPTLITVS